MDLEYGAHLPLIDFGSGPADLAELREYARRAATLGYKYLCANDHMLFQRPWLDGPTALAATVDAAEGMTIATTVALPVIRGPVQTAKTLAALDLLSGGRLVAGLGPGSSPGDYAAVGVPFEERWKRFDEAIQALRSLLRKGAGDFSGSFYSTGGLVLEPRPPRPEGPPLWVASWGSPAGLRRVSRLGDGWLASGYNTTPATFSEGVAELGEGMPNGLSTMWLYVTESPREAERVLADILAPLLNRSVDALRELALPIGSVEQCAERVSAYARAGVERIFVWPLTDDLRQLQLFMDGVVPLVSG